MPQSPTTHHARWAFALLALTFSGALQAQYEEAFLLNQGNFVGGGDQPGDRFGTAVAVGRFADAVPVGIAGGKPGESSGSGRVSTATTFEFGPAFFYGINAIDAANWGQSTDGIPGTNAENERFGQALAFGDFDGNGYDDLVIGTPGEDIESANAERAGTITIIYGNAGGLNSGTDIPQPRLFAQSSTGFLNDPERNDRMGEALASGDFNCDGFDDLAIGTPFEDIRNFGFIDVPDAGAVYVLYGSDNAGLITSGMQRFHQGTPGIAGVLNPGDRFGEQLAVGHFNRDDCADLVIGVTREDLGDEADTGRVHVLYGSTNRLEADGSQAFDLYALGLDGTGSAGSRFGEALATGDFDGNGIDDLAIGAPYRGFELRFGGAFVPDRGTVYVIYAADEGRLDPSAIPPTVLESFTTLSGRYGDTLAAGDVNRDGFDDLIAVAPLENAAGLLWTTLGGAGGLVRQRSTSLNLAVFPGLTEQGASIRRKPVVMADFDGNGADDVLLGAPGAAVQGIEESGVLIVILSEDPPEMLLKDGFE